MANERYPRNLVVNNIKDRANIRKSAKANNMASISQSTPRHNPAKGTYGVDLADWVSHAIAQGWIANGDTNTNAFNTNLTSSTSRSHTIGLSETTETFDFNIYDGDADENQFQLRLGRNATSGYVRISSTEWGTIDRPFFQVGTGSNLTMRAATGNLTMGYTVSSEDYNGGHILITNDPLSTTAVKIQGHYNAGTTVNAMIALGDYDDNGNTTFLTINDQTGDFTFSSTTGGVIMPRMTGAQVVALTPSNGMIVYATSTSGAITQIGFWGYVNGTWTALH